jgi:hypothetical protein
MSSPVKITRDLRIVAPPDAPPLTGSQALELGKKLLERGCIAVALEAVEPRRVLHSRAVSQAARR